MPYENSLFYLAATSNGQVLINKRQIETAKNLSQAETEIVMVTGQKLIVSVNYGDLMFHLLNNTPQNMNP